MRLRLFGLLLTLIVLVVAALLVPLSVSYAASAQQRVLIDRLDDTNQFAAEARAGLRGDKDLASLRDMLFRYEEVYGIPTAVIDRHQVVLVNAGPVDLTDAAVAERIDVAFSGRRAQETVGRWPWRTEPMIVAVPFSTADETGVAGVVVTVSPTDKVRGQVARAWLGFGAGGLLALIVFAGVAAVLARWILRPVSSLDAAAAAIARGDLEQRAPQSSGPPELRRLARTFNEMAATVSASLEQQRRFVAQASHQMRNPLTVLLLRLDNFAGAMGAVGGSGEGLPPRARTEYDEAVSEGRRLRRTLDEMLSLARAERHLGAVRAEDIGAILDERLAAWRLRADLRDQLLVRAGAASAVAVVDADSLGRAVDEVLDNAVRFAPVGGVIVADLQPATAPPLPAATAANGTVAPEQPAAEVRLIISDDGDGLPADEFDRVTDPFWRGKSHANVPGTGLGMSIVAQLLQTFGARPEFAPAESGGLAVTLVLPAAQPARPVPAGPAATDGPSSDRVGATMAHGLTDR